MVKSSSLNYDFSIIRELRQQKKVSLKKLASETGVSFSTLARIESNQNQPSLQTLSRLSGFFGLTPANLLDLASSFVVERAEEKLEDLGLLPRRGVSFPDLRLRVNEGKAGDTALEAHQHLGEYQVTWVLKGRIVVSVHGQDHEISAGQAIKFDASFDHTIRCLKDTSYVVGLVPKRTK